MEIENLENENISEKRLWWIYSLPLARHLIENGFECLKTVPDLVKPGFYNFLFKDTVELHKSIEVYNIEKMKTYVKERCSGKKCIVAFI